MLTAGAKSQPDQGAGIGNGLCLKAVILLVALHRLLGGDVPVAGRRAGKIVFANQRLLDLGRALLIDGLLSA